MCPRGRKPAPQQATALPRWRQKHLCTKRAKTITKKAKTITKGSPQKNMGFFGNFWIFPYIGEGGGLPNPKTFVSSDRSSYSDSGLLYFIIRPQPLFEISSISSNINFFFLQIECRLIIIDPGHIFSLFLSFLSFSLYFSLFSLFFSLFISFICLLLSFSPSFSLPVGKVHKKK